MPTSKSSVVAIGIVLFATATWKFGAKFNEVNELNEMYQRTIDELVQDYDKRFKLRTKEAYEVYQRTIEELVQDYDQRLREQNGTHTMQMGDLTKKYGELLAVQAEDHKIHIASLKKTHTEELKMSINELRSTLITNCKHQLEENIEKRANHLSQQCDKRVKVQAGNHEKRMAVQAGDHKKQIASLKTVHAEKLSTVRDTLRSTLQKNCQRQLRKEKEQYTKTSSQQCNRRMAVQAADHKKQTASLKKAHAKKLETSERKMTSMLEEISKSQIRANKLLEQFQEDQSNTIFRSIKRYIVSLSEQLKKLASPRKIA